MMDHGTEVLVESAHPAITVDPALHKEYDLEPGQMLVKYKEAPWRNTINVVQESAVVLPSLNSRSSRQRQPPTKLGFEQKKIKQEPLKSRKKQAKKRKKVKIEDIKAVASIQEFKSKKSSFTPGAVLTTKQGYTCAVVDPSTVDLAALRLPLVVAADEVLVRWDGVRKGVLGEYAILPCDEVHDSSATEGHLLRRRRPPKEKKDAAKTSKLAANKKVKSVKRDSAAATGTAATRKTKILPKPKRGKSVKRDAMDTSDTDGAGKTKKRKTKEKAENPNWDTADSSDIQGTRHDLTTDHSDVYEVEEVVDCRQRRQGQWEYKIKWQGDYKQLTWVRDEDLNPAVIEEARTLRKQTFPDYFDLAEALEQRTPSGFQFTSETHRQSNFDFAFETKIDKEVMKQCAVQKPRVLELFSGVGGMSLGFEREGFGASWMVDKDVNLQASLATRGIAYARDSNEFLEDCENGQPGYPSQEEPDHIHASSPCQGYSIANTLGSDDDREENNILCHCLSRAVEHFQPTTATFENVSGMLRESNHEHLIKLVCDLLAMNYQVRVTKLCAADYGDPQTRFRLFLFIAKAGFPLPKRPQETHGPGTPKHHVTVQQALVDLETTPPHRGGLVKLGNGIVHNHESSEQEMSTDDKRIDGNSPSTTICTSEDVWHYKLDRKLTCREIARLFSFPDSFVLYGSRQQQRRQLGNAVPVKMAQAVAKTVLESYRRIPSIGSACIDVERVDR